MEEIRQNSVELLVKQINQILEYVPLNRWDKIRDVCQQAKEMHKKETEEYGALCCLKTMQKKQWSLDQLYNETFGK